MNHKALDCTALTIAIIGAINWGLIGLFSFDLVAFIFGNLSWISRIIYALVAKWAAPQCEGECHLR